MYLENHHTPMANATIWLAHLQDFWYNLLGLFVEWYNVIYTLGYTYKVSIIIGTRIG